MTVRSLLLSVACALLFSTFILKHAGIPAFQQDWNWPASERQVRALLDVNAHGWAWRGLGSKHVYPFAEYVIYALAHIALHIGPKAALILYLASCIAFGTYGSFMLIRRCGATSFFACAAGALSYIVSPVMYNKIAAGHTYYWIAYACFPWILVAFEAEESSPWLAFSALSTLLALSWAQAQFIVFDLLLIGTILFVRRNRRSFAVASGATVMAIIVHFYSFATLLAPTYGFTLHFQEATIAGVKSESVSWSDALSLSGYPPGYYLTITQKFTELRWLPYLWIAVGFLAIIGLFLGVFLKNYRKNIIVPVSLTGVIGIILVRGISPPFGFLLVFMFEHFAFMAILKELYHAAALVALAWSVGVAVTCDCLLHAEESFGCAAGFAFRLRRTTIGILLIALPYALLPPAGDYAATQVDFEQAGTLDATLARAEDTLAQPARVLLEPMFPPLQLRTGREGGGVDPNILQPWQLSSLSEIFFEPYVGKVAEHILHGSDEPLSEQLAQLGVGVVILSKDIVSSLPQQADLPTNISSRFSTEHLIRALRDPNLVRILNDRHFLVLRNRRFFGFGTVAGAPLLTEEHLSGVASRGKAHLFPPDIETATAASIPIVDLRRSSVQGTLFPAFLQPTDEIDVGASITQFDARRGWTADQYAYYWNGWIDDTEFGSIFTFGRFPLELNVRAPAAQHGVLVLEIASGNRVLSSAEYIQYGRTEKLPLRLTSDTQSAFKTYVTEKTLRAPHHARLFIDPGESGISVRRVFFTSEHALREARSRAERLSITSLDASEQPAKLITSAPTKFTYQYAHDPGICTFQFRTAFDPLWQAWIDDDPRTLLPHMRIDGWMNGWRVPCGRHRVIISFDDAFYRRCFFLGSSLMTLLFVACLTLLNLSHLFRDHQAA
jgi:hypothetical protein